MKRAIFLIVVFNFLAPVQPSVASDAGLSFVTANTPSATQPLITPDFLLRNDGRQPALFQVTIKRIGMSPAVISSSNPSLEAWPDQLLVLPGQAKVISLAAVAAVAEEEQYDVFVEQLPVFFGPPGAATKGGYMEVKQFVASVSLRPGGAADVILASNSPATSAE